MQIINYENLNSDFYSYQDFEGIESVCEIIQDVKNRGDEAIIEYSKKFGDGDPIPDIFKGEYELVFKLSAEALLNAYSGIFTKAALSRITGINERQLWHYAAGMKKPRPKQLKRIEDGIHKLGRELIAVTL